MPTEQDLKSHYNKHVKYASPVNERTIDHVLATLDLDPLRDSTCIDLGCGTGWFTNYWNRHGGICIGVDYAGRRIDAAQEMYPASVFRCQSIQSYIADWKPGYVPPHIITMWDVVEHLEDPVSVIQSARVVGERVVATIPINMAYEAHLQVYKDADEILERLNPSLCIETSAIAPRKYALCMWKGIE